jgi:NAD(P)-dependent dehydrogenase (short-subunit alcohol dehydrogenase family)
MAFSISDTVALVSGANRGIGKSLVEALVKRGARKVYAGARKLASLGDLVGDRVVGIELDITSSDQLKAAAEAAPDLNLLINNAGVVAGPLGLEITNPDSLVAARNEMEVNYHGTLAASQAFAPILAASGGGTLVNVGSVGGLANFPVLATYSASKAALHSLTQALRLGLGAQGTYVAGVYPGPVDTDLAAEVQMDKTSPRVVADNILDALEAGQEEIFPDPMAQEMGTGYEASPKGLERQIAEMVAAMAAEA